MQHVKAHSPSALVLFTAGVPLVIALAAWPAQAALNDTGISKSQCYQAGSDTLGACATSTLRRQDAVLGRDANSATNGGANGVLGFSFVKVCHSGQQAGTGTCPANPALGSATNRWGCTRDTVTGLTWELKTTSGLRSNALNYTNYSPAYDPVGAYGSTTDATGYVAQVNAAGLCGASDWRLPATGELHGIAHFGRVPISDGSDGYIAIDTAWFPNTLDAQFWAAEPFVLNPSNHWNVDTDSGRATNQIRSRPIQVRLVRGGIAPPAQRYMVSADGLEVHDALLGLAWRRCPEGLSDDTVGGNGPCGIGSLLKFTHEAAFVHAADQALLAGLPWRLPNAKEMATLVDRSLSRPAIDRLAFPKTPQLKFWTSTPIVKGDLAQRGHTVDFYQGYLDAQGRNASNPLRLVRPLP